MAFVNEYLLDEDKKKHNITNDSNFYLAGNTSWTVDRNGDMFLLRRAGGGPESEPGVAYWAFYWKGHLLDIKLKSIDSGGDPSGKHGWERTRVLSIGRFPPEMHHQRDAILADLKDALTAHKGIGIYSRRTSYVVELEA